MTKGNAVRMTISLLCLAGSAAALYNVYHDNTELKATAERIACEKACFKFLGEQRTPFSQVFSYQPDSSRAETRVIECTRQAIFVGSYTCRQR
jgi:hypothetical protein